MQSPKVTIKKGRNLSLQYLHPWIFSGALAGVDGGPPDGSVVTICDPAGGPCAVGFYNSRSQIAVRVLAWQPGVEIDEAFLRGRIERAVRARQGLADEEGTDAYRLVHAEADRLPGLIVDRYGDYLVIQLSSLGMEQRHDQVVRILQDLLSPKGIRLVVDEDLREKEGLELDTGWLAGEAPTDLRIQERGLHYHVDLEAGQKTGFYLDQRRNRTRVANLLRGDVLDAFSYSGSFGLWALRVGCESVTHLDASDAALDLARRNRELNGFSWRDEELVKGNAFEVLRTFRDKGMSFDTIVLDPPKLALSKSHTKNAMRAYKDLNLLGMKLLKEEGTLISFSCSHALPMESLRTVVFNASIDSGRDVQIVDRLGQGTDHRVSVHFPESEYLKGLVMRVTS